MIYLIYNIISILAFPLYLLIYVYRFVIGKETTDSIAERLVINTSNRPEGRLLWLHAASVGEAMVAQTVIKAIAKRHKDMNFLLTTGTLSSAIIVSKWHINNLYHQYTPNDNILLMNLFLNKWQPQMAIFIESELWPCMLHESARHCPVILINARLSDRSFARWQKYNFVFSSLTKNISLVLAQSEIDLQKYLQLGVSDAQNFGNLKFSNEELAVNLEDVSRIKKIIGSNLPSGSGPRSIFVAASTHLEDEEVVAEVTKRLLAKKLDFFTIIVLRHPERRSEIMTLCDYNQLRYSLRSKHKLPHHEDDIFIVDTFGELGTFYTLADVVLVGGSFKHGGHNLVEPAYFDCAILVGPDMSNFQSITNEMVAKRAALQLKSMASLEDQLKLLLSKDGEKLRKELSANAHAFVRSRKEIITSYLDKIDEFITGKTKFITGKTISEIGHASNKSHKRGRK